MISCPPQGTTLWSSQVQLPLDCTPSPFSATQALNYLEFPLLEKFCGALWEAISLVLESMGERGYLTFHWGTGAIYSALFLQEVLNKEATENEPAFCEIKRYAVPNS